jgi:hypothetical protein
LAVVHHLTPFSTLLLLPSLPPTLKPWAGGAKPSQILLDSRLLGLVKLGVVTITVILVIQEEARGAIETTTTTTTTMETTTTIAIIMATD